jgi:hypothetical protein
MATVIVVGYFNLASLWEEETDSLGKALVVGNSILSCRSQVMVEAVS